MLVNKQLFEKKEDADAAIDLVGAMLTAKVYPTFRGGALRTPLLVKHVLDRVVAMYEKEFDGYFSFFE